MNHQFPSAAELGRSFRSQRQIRTQSSSQRQQFQNPYPNPYATSTRAVTTSVSNPASSAGTESRSFSNPSQVRNIQQGLAPSSSLQGSNSSNPNQLRTTQRGLYSSSSSLLQQQIQQQNGSQRNNYYNNSNQMLRNIQQETVSSSAFQQQNLQSGQASRRNDSNTILPSSQSRPSLYSIRRGINRSLPREIEENDDEERRRDEGIRPEQAPSSPHNSSNVSMKSTDSGSARMPLEGVNDDDHHDTDPSRTEEEEEEQVSSSEKSADLEDVSSVSNHHGSEQHQHCQHSSMKFPESKSSEWKLYTFLTLLGLACIGLIVGFVVAAADGGGSGSNSSSYSEEEQAKAVENFKLNFQQDAAQLQQVIQSNIENVVDRFVAWSDRITDMVDKDITTEWPYVTLSQMEAESDILQKQLGVKQISFHPVIYPEDKEEWEQYVGQNYGSWMRESYRYRGMSNKVPKLETDFINHGLYVWEEAKTPIQLDYEQYDPFYLPYWQVAPLVDNESLVQFDGLVFDFLQDVVKQVLNQQSQPHSSRKPVLSHAINVRPLIGDQPESILSVPIFEKNLERSLVGIFLVTVPWDIFYEHLLPSETIQFVTNSIDCNSAGSTNDELLPATKYQVGNDGVVTFMGVGDGNVDVSDAVLAEGIPLKLDASFAWIETCQPDITLVATVEYQEGFMSATADDDDGSNESSSSVVFVIVLGILVLLLLGGVIYLLLGQRRSQNAAAREKNDITSTRNAGGGSSTSDDDDIEHQSPESDGGDAREGSSPQNIPHQPPAPSPPREMQQKRPSFTSQPSRNASFTSLPSRSASFTSTAAIDDNSYAAASTSVGNDNSRPPLMQAGSSQPGTTGSENPTSGGLVPLINMADLDDSDNISLDEPINGRRDAPFNESYICHDSFNENPRRPASFTSPTQEHEQPQLSYRALMSPTKQRSVSNLSGDVLPGAVRVNGAGALLSAQILSPNTDIPDHHQQQQMNRMGNSSVTSLSLADIQHSNHNSTAQKPALAARSPIHSGSPGGEPETTSASRTSSASQPAARSDLATVIAQREQQLRDKTATPSSSRNTPPTPSPNPTGDLAATIARREQQLKAKAGATKNSPRQLGSPASETSPLERSGSALSGDIAVRIAQREQQLKNKTVAANKSQNPILLSSAAASPSASELMAPTTPPGSATGTRSHSIDSPVVAGNSSSMVMVLTPRRTRSRTWRQQREQQLQLQDISRTQNPSISAFQNGTEQSTDLATEVFDKPIADTFDNCTIMFADLVGFTSWSSEREPTQIFNLLESLFNAFDKLAKQRGVFKVVTIGDCYVSATGVPKARRDHAVAMVRFAKECMIVMKKIFAKIQSATGEDTSRLSMRFGMSSGPVTGGIVRGSKAQFQLFGDTMNAASKVESMGEKDRIHISETTALHLIEAGREQWLQPRDEQLYVNGKSAEQTYWINFCSNRFGGSAGNLSFSMGDLDDLDFSDHDMDDFEYDHTDIDDSLIKQLMKDVGGTGSMKGQSLASKYPSCTICFGEVDGFTQWSAQKEPYQVFMLLEALFKAFDKIAKRREIFKIETIADCYVASAGAPYRRDDHAVAMAVFAHECLLASDHVISELASTLGGGSEQLGMRFGLHSGPVMAGVLRGEKCRFQFFGDTMNTASRMESNGVKRKIQISEATADLIRISGKGKWLEPREEKVKAKGKGMMQTYWVEARVKVAGAPARNNKVSYDNMSSEDDSDKEFVEGNSMEVMRSREEEKMYGLIDATVDILERLLKKIVAKRGYDDPVEPEPAFQQNEDSYVIDEMVDMIKLPSEATQFKISPAMVRVEESILKELRDFVSVIAFMYADRQYNSFERASFIVEQTNRILARTVNPQNIEFIGMTEEDKIAAKNMKEYSNKIRQDPMTQFAMVFAALVQGLNHPGVPDEDVATQCTDLAIMYNNRCVVEQNALDTSWDMFMDPQYSNLRTCIYRSEAELKRFRQLVVNCVIGSNLYDSELKYGRNRRWKKAFVSLDGSSTNFDFSVSNLNAGDDMNLKATIAIEHIMQGAIWTHTMQRFEMFVKWNERQFQEHFDAFKNGRTLRDPFTDWYYMQLRFFDTYVIPLASRLVETELFGYNGEEYLRNAKRNRQEWELKGRDLVDQFMSNTTL